MKKIIANALIKALAQFIYQNFFILIRILLTELFLINIDISYRIIRRYLIKIRYQKNFTKATLMLIINHRYKQIELALNYLNDNWNNTLFIDKTAFQLF